MTQSLREWPAAGLRTTVALVLLSLAGMADSATATRFTAEDMLDIVTVRDDAIQLSPDGNRIAYVSPDMEDENNVLNRRPSGYVRIAGLGSAAAPASRQLTEGTVHSSFPAWSPDGRYLAYFVESPSGFQLTILDVTSGETRTAGSPFQGDPYLAPQWDSGGNYIVYARATKIPQASSQLFLPPPTFARAAQLHPPEDFPRVVVLESSDKRLPGDLAFIDRERAILSSFELSSGEETDLNDAPVYLRDFSVSPGAATVIFRAPSEETRGLVGGEVLETFVVDVDGGYAPRRVDQEGKRLHWGPAGDRLFYLQAGDLHAVAPAGGRSEVFLDLPDLSVSSFGWSPDGKWLAVLAADESVQDPEVEPPMENMYSIADAFMNLYVIAVRNKQVREVAVGSADNLDVTQSLWSPDSTTLVYKSVNRETYDEQIWRYDVESGESSALTGGAESFGDLKVQADTVLFTAESATHPADIYAVDLNGNARRKAVSLNPQIERFAFSQPELFHFTGGNGTRLGALLYRPAGVSPSEKVPVITYVYEKLTPLRHRFNARQQIFLSHGFAVLMPNVKIRVGEPGTSYVDSVVPATAAVEEMGFTNGKFAIWGGSFGAYATSFIITQTDTFACAVSRATPPELFNNWASGRDRDSQNIVRGQARIGGGPYEVPERYLAQSAFFHLDNVDTPILIMHGAQDATILFDEGEMLFYALRQLGKPATFVAYTHGDHSLYRRSRADAIDVHRRMLDWFDKYLR